MGLGDLQFLKPAKIILAFLASQPLLSLGPFLGRGINSSTLKIEAQGCASTSGPSGSGCPGAQTKTYWDPPAERGGRFWTQRELALICCTVNDNNAKNENMVWGGIAPQEPNILVFKGTLMSLSG